MTLADVLAADESLYVSCGSAVRPNVDNRPARLRPQLHASTVDELDTAASSVEQWASRLTVCGAFAGMIARAASGQRHMRWLPPLLSEQSQRSAEAARPCRSPTAIRLAFPRRRSRLCNPFRLAGANRTCFPLPAILSRAGRGTLRIARPPFAVRQPPFWDEIPDRQPRCAPASRCCNYISVSACFDQPAQAG